MRNMLIIKLGALGDVVRTTPLLRVLEGKMTWVTLRVQSLRSRATLTSIDSIA